jgi:hypothetical protein
LLGEEGERANGKSLEWVFYVRAGICCFEVLDRLEAPAGEDITEIDSRRWNELAGGCADEGVVLAWWKTVQKRKIVELALASAFLNELMVEVVHLSRIGAEKDAVRNEVLGNLGGVDAIEEALKVRKLLGGHPGGSRGVERLCACGFQRNDPRGEFTVECNRAPAHPNEGVNVAKVSPGEARPIEDECVGGWEFRRSGHLLGRVWIFRKKNVGDLVEVGRRHAREEPVEFDE